MKKNILPLFATAVLMLGANSAARAQITTCGDAFIKGDLVEVGVHPNGGFGSSCAAPTGYHPDVAGTGDALGFVSDPEKDGWLVSVPPSPRYMGDYFVPGSPYEGWSIQANGGTLAYGRGRTGSSGITGSNISYTATASQQSTVWQGTYGNLSVTQTTTLKKDKLYFVMSVDIVNSGTTSIPNIYYFRGVDPDNEVAWGGPSGGYVTSNEIVYQPNPTSTNCLVTGTGIDWPYMSYLGLGTKDCRARCMNLPGWYPSSLAEAFTGLGSGAGFQRAVGWKTPSAGGADEAIGVVWNLGTLAPGQKTSLAYTYILKKADLDSALQETAPKFVSDGVPFAPYSTLRVCPGKSVPLKIINGGQYKWIWTPSANMNPVPGTTIVGPGGTIPTVTGTYAYTDGAALGDSIEVNVFGPKTYRATGISNCDTQILIFYVDTISFSVPPAVTTPVRYCEGDAATALTAGTATGATLRWYSAATGGTPITTPTPSTGFPAGSTADYDTTHYYVSQVNPAGCETPRARIDVIITRKPLPPAVTSLIYCKGVIAPTLTATGDNLKWFDAATGGTRYSSTPTPATTTAGVVSYFVSQTVNGCESDRAQLDVETSQIVAEFDMLRDSICGDDLNMYYNRSKSTAVTDTNYHSLWHFGDGSSDDTTKDANHTFPEGRTTYTVHLKVTNVNGCVDSVDHTVWTFPRPEMTVTASDTIICQGDAIDFTGTATTGYSGLKWDFGDTDPAYNTLTVRHAFSYGGKFTVKLIGNYPACPDANASIPVTITPIPAVNLGPDTFLCTGSTAIVLYNKSGVSAEHYLWSTGDTTATITINHEGDYWLKASNDDCTATDSITVTKSCYLDVPNAFTPGAGSEANNYFLPRQLMSKAVVTFDMKIFDRWGQLLFESDKTDGRGWDGNYKGKPMEMGVYVYMIKVSFTNGITESYQGNLTLIR